MLRTAPEHFEHRSLSRSIGRTHPKQNAAARDPMKCERDPSCSRERGRYPDCTRQCADNPECMRRCEEVQQGVDAMGHP